MNQYYYSTFLKFNFNMNDLTSRMVRYDVPSRRGRLALAKMFAFLW